MPARSRKREPPRSIPHRTSENPVEAWAAPTAPLRLPHVPAIARCDSRLPRRLLRRRPGPTLFSVVTRSLLLLTGTNLRWEDYRVGVNAGFRWGVLLRVFALAQDSRHVRFPSLRGDDPMPLMHRHQAERCGRIANSKSGIPGHICREALGIQLFLTTIVEMLRQITAVTHATLSMKLGHTRTWR